MYNVKSKWGVKSGDFLISNAKKLNKRFTLLEIILNILRRMTFTDRMLSFNKKQSQEKGRKKENHYW